VIAPDQLPRGWAVARLGDVLALKYGKALPDRDRDGSGAPVYGSNGIVGRHSLPLIAGPAVIVGRKGSIGAVHLSVGPCSPIDTTYYVDEFNGQPPEFWFHILRSLDLAGLNRATAVPGLNREDAYNLVVPVPPVPEQRRIVVKLDELFASSRAAQAALDTVPTLLEQYRQALLAAAFREEERDGTYARYCLEALVPPGRTITYGIVQTGSPAVGGVPTVRCGDIKQFDVAVDILKRVSPEVEAQYPRTRLKGGEVLLAIRGSVGEVAVAPTVLAGANVSREVAVIPVRDDVEPAYLMYLLASPAVARSIIVQVKGVAQSGINIADLRRIDVPLPSRERQMAIVCGIQRALASIERMAHRVGSSRSDISILEQATLTKAFRGDLASQDPSDEPASSILARLRSEPVGVPAIRAGRRRRGRP
jgi:type I restriction enzyme S subunit